MKIIRIILISFALFLVSAAVHIIGWYFIVTETDIFYQPTHVRELDPAIFSDYSYPWDLLMFPTDESELFEDEELSIPMNRVLESPIVVNYLEAANGSVGKFLPDNQYGFVSYDTLKLFPEKIEKKKLHGSYGDYYSWDWSEKKLGEGRYRVTFDHRDNKHARANRYIYETDGKEIFSISTGVISGVEMGMFMAVWFVISFPFTLIGVIVIFLAIRYMRKVRAGKSVVPQ